MSFWALPFQTKKTRINSMFTGSNVTYKRYHVWLTGLAKTKQLHKVTIDILFSD